jgi:tRNA pseudouridine38-40 synthase
MPRYAILFAYDGSGFCGWQNQSGTGKHENPKPGIEGVVTRALTEASGETATVVASGRTDAGVHATGQVAHFTLAKSPQSQENFLLSLNQHLPPEVQIHRLAEVPDSFSARYADFKRYSYYFQQGSTDLPHLRCGTTWNRRPLDGDQMHRALQQVIGEHDFLPFGSSRANVSTTIRTIFKAGVTREEIPFSSIADDQFLWRIQITGSGFLMHMMRSIAGTLKQIGEGRRPPEDMLTILHSGDRELVGPTAPARGLWLDQVGYSSDGEPPLPSWLSPPVD